MRWLDKAISQDVKRNRNDDQYAEDSEGYEEDSWSSKMEGFILMTSINNQMTNAMNILEISENLQYLIQSNIEDQIFQIQRMLANKLDRYKGRRNSYVDKNI